MTGSWTEVIGQHELSEKWCLGTTAISQHYRMFDDFQLLLFRMGLAYRFSGDALVSAGYDYFYSESYSEDRPKLQHRTWEEFNLGSRYSTLAISHRYRFESIWTRQEPQYDLSHRLRYRLKLEHPLYKNLYLSAFNEIFINVGKPYFNQNRMALGLGYRLNPDLRVELGYLKLHFDHAHYDRLRLAMFFKTNLFSKDKN
ncbi:DUF2490 domain-containing protein [Salinimicrobium sp. TH3]|uniref:DUF2490 domain-containing protein n=1 Tax=Salinimicrobium sp. TH3 TaxID=2997342 RepID=UPI002272BDE5|nr:DUF2490 domain-containing protein [Salinimicrobium sp. TH3]MCY2686425.1 DUF2490 domain-containing protein [Salinimicrobium sp. TH3]